MLPIKRIVVLNCDALEVLRILKATSKVVGVCREVDRDKKFWGSLTSLPRVGTWKNVNPEALFALNPDLVIAYGHNPGTELDREMKALHIQLIRLNFYKIKTLAREIIILGRILNREKEAHKFVTWFNSRLRLIQKKVSKSKTRPRVYCESYSDFIAVGPGSGSNEMCVMAGGDNIGKELSIPFARVSAEWVVSHDPQVIIKPSAATNGYEARNISIFKKIKKSICNRRGFSHISAVKYGKVYVIDSSIWTGPAALIGVAYLTIWFHPNFSKEIKPHLWHMEYMKEFLHMSYRGFYVYN